MLWQLVTPTQVRVGHGHGEDGGVGALRPGVCPPALFEIEATLSQVIVDVYACKIIEHPLNAGRAWYSRRALALRQLAVIVGHDLVGGAHVR